MSIPTLPKFSEQYFLDTLSRSTMGSSMDVQESEFSRIASGDLVEVCELFSPTHFYLHRVQERSKVDRVMGEMRKAYGMSVDRRELLVNPAEVELGMMAAARWGDEGWHRVKVIGFRTNKVEVIYVDFGTRGEVLKNRLYRLCSYFLKESPPLAISAGLKLKPRPPATCWSEGEAIARLQALVKPDAQVPFTAKFFQVNDRVVLDLRCPSSGRYLSELLVEEGMALFEGTIDNRTMIREPKSRLLSMSVLNCVVKKVKKAPVLPVSMLSRLERLVDMTVAMSSGHEEMVFEQERLASDTLALSLELLKTRWDVKRERIEGWEERRRREAMEKLQTSESSVQTRSSLEVSVSDSGVASDVSLFSKTPNLSCSSLESHAASPRPGESLHPRHIDNKVVVAKKEVSALVAGFKGRDLLADRMSRLGIELPTAGVEDELLPMESLSSILQLVEPEAMNAVSNI